MPQTHAGPRRSLGAVVLLLGGLAATQARGALPLELPPGEDPEAWQGAVEVARQLIPDLELGSAIGGPGVRVVVKGERWALDIHTRAGQRQLMVVPAPEGDEGRVELLLVCAEVIGSLPPVAESALPSPEPEPPPLPETIPPLPEPPPITHHWHTGLAVGSELRSDGSLGLLLRAEPLAWSGARIGAAPVVSWSSATTLAEGLELRSAQLGLRAGLHLDPQARLRIGPEAAVSLRELRTDDLERRDWSWVLGGAMGLAAPIRGAMDLELGLRMSTELPPTLVSWRGEEIAAPSWRLQGWMGLRFRHREGEPAVVSDSDIEGSAIQNRAHRDLEPR